MHVSRRVLSQALASDHGFLIPPRSSMNILASSAQACFTLVTSTTKRDECLQLLNNGVINAPVLGIPMTLALYNDLSSPLLDKHKFNSEDFMEGAKIALDQYHSVEGHLQNETLDKTLERLKQFNADTNDSNEGETKVTEEEDSNGLTMSQKHLWMQHIQEKIESHDPLNNEWKKEANDNPESLVAQLMSMVTPTYFQNLFSTYFASAPLVLLDPNPPKYVSSEISNIALLSARAEIIPPSPVSREEEENLNEADKQKNDDILNNIYGDIDELPVAAQVEVLYDMIFERSTQNASGNLEEGVDNNESPIDDENKGETIKGAVVQVAVFEGWLHRSPDGSDLRWQLATVRNPWEFR